MPRNVTRRLWTARETCEFLRISERTLSRYVAAGLLRPVQLVPGGRRRFRVDELERLIGGPVETREAAPDEEPCDDCEAIVELLERELR